MSNNLQEINCESRQEFYRNTTLARSLQEVLDEFEELGEINEMQNEIIMMQLDNQIVENFKNVPRNNKAVKITGFTTYRFREDP